MSNFEIEDVLLHVVGAIAFAVLWLIFVGHSWCLFAGINALFWFVREVIQDLDGDHPLPWPLRWSTQKFFEFVAPTLIGLLFALGI